jgi:hypothetical protein
MKEFNIWQTLSASLLLSGVLMAQVRVQIPDGVGNPSTPPSPGTVDICDSNPSSTTQVVEVIANAGSVDTSFKAQKVDKDGNPVGPVREITSVNGFPFSLAEGEKVVAWDMDDPSNEDDKKPTALVTVR